MRPILHLSAAAMFLLLSACGAAEDDTRSEASVENAQDEVRDDREAWLMSDARPVNLACNAPGYSRGQPETYVGLHSPLYPSIQAKQEKLLQKLRDLTPTVTDEDMHDVVAYNEVKQQLSILAQFTFLMGVDLPPRSTLGLCTFELYDMDKCVRMARMLGDDFDVKDVVKDGDALRFTALLNAESTKIDMDLKNSDFDTVRMNMQGGDNLQAEWIRGSDGIERLESRSTDATYSYTENPDCSGTARMGRLGGNGKLWMTGITWSSVRDENFSMSYSDCKENDLGEQQCKSGGL